MCKEDDTRACCAGGYHAAWSEEPGHTEILSRTSAGIRRHWRAGVSISNNLTIVSARLVTDRCALCTEDVSLSSWLAPIPPPFPTLPYPPSVHLLALSLFIYIYACRCASFVDRCVVPAGESL